MEQIPSPTKINTTPKIINFKTENGETLPVDLNQVELKLKSENSNGIDLSIFYKEIELGGIGVIPNDKGEAVVMLSRIKGETTDMSRNLIEVALYKILKLFKMHARNTNQGKGIGKEIYIKAGEWLSNKNLKLVSSETRSNNSEFLWRSLEKKGLARKIKDLDKGLTHYEFINQEDKKVS